MKKVGKALLNILIILYIIIAIFVTVLLLSYNKYGCSVLGNYTFVLLTDDELEPAFNEGDLVLVKQTKAKNIKEGDYIFFYRHITSAQHEIRYAEVLLVDDDYGIENREYMIEGNTIVKHQDVIGSTEKMKVIPHLGTVLSILESRYGYLFFIVMISFIAFLYEVYELIMEIKYGDRE